MVNHTFLNDAYLYNSLWVLCDGCYFMIFLLSPLVWKLKIQVEFYPVFTKLCKTVLLSCSTTIQIQFWPAIQSCSTYAHCSPSHYSVIWPTTTVIVLLVTTKHISILSEMWLVCNNLRSIYCLHLRCDHIIRIRGCGFILWLMECQCHT